MSGVTSASMSDFKADAVSLTAEAQSEVSGVETARVVSVNRDAIPAAGSDPSSAILALKARVSESDISRVKAYLTLHREETEMFLRGWEYVENIVERPDGRFDIQIGRPLGYPPSSFGLLWELTAKEFQRLLKFAQAKRLLIKT